MTSFELNKIAAAVLVAGITVMVAGTLGGLLVKSPKLEKNVYIVQGMEASASTASGAAAASSGAAPDNTPSGETSIAPIAPLLASATVKAGEAAAKKCVACHSFEKGGANKVGPNLWDVVGAKHAHNPAFAYSDGIKSKAAEAWTYEDLNKFIANPKAYAPGTKMSFAGVKKAEERADVIVYLRSLSDSPKPLP